MSTETTEIIGKKFVIIKAAESSATIYRQSSPTDPKGRLQLTINPRIPLYCRHTFTDKNGRQRNTRYKNGASSIFMDEQIEKDKIPANEKFTDLERGDLMLINGVLYSEDESILSFLHEDNNPQREEFTGRDRRGITPLFRLLDEQAEAEDENSFIFKTAEALTIIKKMNLDEVGALLSIFYGSSFTVPTKLKEAQNIAAKALENNEERLDLVIEGVKGSDQEIVVLLGKALNQGIISFAQKEDYVQMMKDGEWRDVKLVSADTYEQREILFRQYLASKEGELLKKDIETLVTDEGEKTKTSNKKK